MKNKITILLGAGFAQYVKGLSTKDINDIFASYSKWKVGKDTLYNYIENALNKYYYDFNFETFLAVIENIYSYRLSQYRNIQTSVTWKGLSSTIFELKPEFEKCECFKNQESTYDVLCSYINLLNGKVSNYDDCTKCKEEINKFKEFIFDLSKVYDKIKIYSTNYDFIVPKALDLRGECLGVTEVIAKQEFSYNIDKFRQLPLTYFPLHGCPYIYQETYGCFFLSSIVQVMPFFAQSSRGGNPNEETLFTPIISGYSKLEHINGRPFNWGFQSFANDCYDSSKIITMGYSYGDKHLNSIIETFSNRNIESVTLNNAPNLSALMSIRVNTNVNGIEDYISNYIKNRKTHRFFNLSKLKRRLCELKISIVERI